MPQKSGLTKYSRRNENSPFLPRFKSVPLRFKVMRKLAIFGAGGFGREVLQIANDLNRQSPCWECAGFLVDGGFEARKAVHGLPVLGGMEWAREHKDVAIVVAIGNPSVRRRIVNQLGDVGSPFATLVHPSAWLGDNVVLGEGCVVCAGTLITTDIKLGAHVHVNIGSTVGHDAVFGDFVTISPGCNISGGVELGDGVELGSGAVVLPGISVGGWSIIGANGVVTSALPANCTAVGMPARAVKFRDAGWHNPS